MSTPFGTKDFAMFVRNSQFLQDAMYARVWDHRTGISKEFTISATTVEAAQRLNPDFDVLPIEVFYNWQRQQA